MRYSLINPFAYQKSNLEGFLNLLELAKRFPPERFVYASSSSVYGGLTEMPFSETQRVDTPISLYAATKKANELMAHAYSHLFGLPTVGLRFFTVYGPWGRPDMAMWLFTAAMLKGRPIKVFNYGQMQRDFTYIDDIVQGVVAALMVPGLDIYEIINLGNHRAEELSPGDRPPGERTEGHGQARAPAHPARRRAGHLCGYCPGPDQAGFSSRSPPLRWGFPALSNGILIITACRAVKALVGRPSPAALGWRARRPAPPGNFHEKWSI